MGRKRRPSPPPPRRTLSQPAWDALMLVLAGLLGAVAGLVVGGLVYSQTHQIAATVIAGGVAFGGVFERTLRIIRMFTGPPGE